MQRRIAAGLGFLAALVGTSGFLGASEASLELFEKRIRPLLLEHCIDCHGADAQEGGLRLDHQGGWRTGGDSGPAIQPEQPEQSLLLRAVRYTDRDLKMPPDGKLPDADIAAIEAWIRSGTADPRASDTPAERWTDPSPAADGRRFWAFELPDDVTPPSLADPDWPSTPIDAYVLSELENQALAPLDDAPAAVLCRRLYYDLIGLPPTPEQLEQFVQAVSAAQTRSQRQAAIEQLVDALLESPHFGERWGRHWLDIARFAESSGGGRTLPFKDAWRYRDYVIDSLNRDVPLDRFIVEQIAGDLLPFQSAVERRRQVIATGFLALGPTNYEQQDKHLLRMDIVDEQLDTIGKSLLGMTIGCARCHDHKFDPIPTRDYYALAGIFRSTRTLRNLTDNVAHWVDTPLPPDEQTEQALQDHAAEVAALKEDLKVAQRAAADDPDQVSRVKEIEARLKALAARAPQRPEAMSVADQDKIEDCCIHIRGNVRNFGEQVPRGVLSAALHGPPPVMPADASGRLELARWIASPQNPLTARVLANRVWGWLFGEGLVRTPSNFGSTGEPPTHPALLDHLARRLIEEGWSLKRIVRYVVLSRTYQLSAVPEHPGRDEPAVQTFAALISHDPDNRLLGRQNRRRLDAESLRDAMLAVSGRLDLQIGGPNIGGAGAVNANDTASQNLEYGYVFSDVRRSVYTPAFRNKRLELFEVFDFADINAPIDRRYTSTVSTQALYLLNHPFVIECSRAAAARLLEDPACSDPERRMEEAYLRCLGRLPSPGERQLVREFLSAGAAGPAGLTGPDGAAPGPADAAVAGADRAAQLQENWSLLFQTLFASLDFRYLK